MVDQILLDFLYLISKVRYRMVFLLQFCLLWNYLISYHFESECSGVAYFVWELLSLPEIQIFPAISFLYWFFCAYNKVLHALSVLILIP